MDRRPLVIVDAANAVGMLPDGWWRRRAEAAELLRDALAPLAETGFRANVLPRGLDWLTRPPLDVALVVEGAAARTGAIPTVRVVAARSSGDDAIVQLVAAEGTARRCAVVTADRRLRARVMRLGAAVVGPSALPRRSRLPAR